MTSIRVATAALSGRIFAGRPLKSGLGFKEPRHDVTSDVLVAIRDKIGIGNQVDVECDGVVAFRIAVLPPASAIEARRAETENTGSVHESAVAKPDAQTPGGGSAMTSTEQVKIAFWTSLTNANAGMKWLDHDSMDEMIEAAWVGFEGPALEALSRNTPADGEVERVALALGAELKRSCGDRAWADNRRSGEDNILAEVDGEIDLEDLARAAIASLPPKPVDGEVAELVERAGKLLAYDFGDESDYCIDVAVTLGEMIRVITRNTEPMVTDAFAAGFAAGVKEGGRQGLEWPRLGGSPMRKALNDYLAMLSAGKKGTDDA